MHNNNPHLPIVLLHLHWHNQHGQYMSRTTPPKVGLPLRRQIDVNIWPELHGQALRMFSRHELASILAALKQTVGDPNHFNVWLGRHRMLLTCGSAAIALHFLLQFGVQVSCRGHLTRCV